jgi:probable AcnD-accessory protein PrpF
VAARDQANSANIAKSQFLANMSHEIRTPLNGVLAMADVMSRGELEPRQRERLGVIRESGELLLSVLNDVLDLSKIEAGKLELETGDFELDGVTFPAAEVQLEFMDPAAEEEGAGGSMFPTGNLIDDLDVPGVGTLKATMINAGIPTIFLNAEQIGRTGTELQDAINGDPKTLAMFETIRAHGAVRMGLIKHVDEAAKRQHTPKVAFVAKPADYVASSGKAVAASDVNLLVRALSMGKLHHAMMGTAAVAIGTAAAIPGTLVNLAAGGGQRDAVRFGHPSGTLRVGAQATQEGGEWVVKKAIMSRSARVLMEGWVRVPGDAF